MGEFRRFDGFELDVDAFRLLRDGARVDTQPKVLDLLILLTEPLIALGDAHLQLIGTGITEAFFTRLMVSLIAAIFVASPVIFFQAWGFIAPGLVERERRGRGHEERGRFRSVRD